MTLEELETLFIERYLKNTCFDSLEELLNDTICITINAPRALIAVDLSGKWRGMVFLNKHINEKGN